MIQSPEELTVAALAKRKPGIEIGPLRPAALKPYQEAFIREMLESTSTKQVTIMKRLNIGHDPFAAEIRAQEIMNVLPVVPMVEFKGVYGKGDGV